MGNGIIGIAGRTSWEQRRFIRRQYDLLFSDKLNKTVKDKKDDGKDENENEEKARGRDTSKTNALSVDKKATLLHDLNMKLSDKPSLKYLLCGLFTFAGEFDAHLIHTALVKRTQLQKSPNLDLLIEVMCTRYVLPVGVC